MLGLQKIAAEITLGKLPVYEIPARFRFDIAYP